TYTIPLKIEIATSIEEEDIAMIRIMPNPAHNQFNIRGLKGAGIESINMYSLMGQMILTNSGPYLDDALNIYLSGLPMGVYVLRMQAIDGRIFTRHIMKQE
ncbi:MAG: T9SS type A sorting domain-containing protein, partial [bacterium]